GDVTFTGANYNIIHDASADQLEFNDSAEISWGTGEDITMAFDGSGGDLDITGSGLEIAFGADDEGIDLVWHTETSGDSITFDESAMDVDIIDVDIDLDDDANLRFGTSDDITIGFDGTGGDLDITGSGLEIAIGVDDEGIDVVWHTETSGDSVTFDESGMDIDIVDVDVGLDDSAILQFGTSDDITVQFDGTNFLIDAIIADEGLLIGDATTGFDVAYRFETAGEFRSDYDGDFINLTDDMDLRFGTGASANGDFQLSSNSSNVLTIGQIVAGTGTIAIGVDDAGLDVTFYGDTTTEYLLWDTSEDTLTSSCGNISFTTIDAEADGFKVDATGAVVGDAINLETTDGGIMLNADGAANGDIELNSADDMIITSAGDTTITTTGTLSVAGSQLTNVLVAVEEITAQTDTITAAESGKVIMVDYTGIATMTLPDAAAGLIFTFIDSSATAGDDLRIDPAAADTIDGAAAGNYIESVTDAVGQAVTLVAIDGTQWFTINVSGTWGTE
ncbi:MAG: hypothetical protein ACYTE3_28085, partial [Planctomycetota bacterium]